MRTVGKFERALQSENGVYEITFSTRDKFAIMKLKEYREDILSIDIAKKKGKRSLNANAYYWVLADEIAKELSKTESRPYTSMDVYKEHIMDVGAFYMRPVKQREVEKFTGIWESKGLGWICDDMGESKLDGYQVMKCYYGSSSYDTEQMTRLINLAVADAKELGIETMTPEEIANLLSLEKEVLGNGNKD